MGKRRFLRLFLPDPLDIILRERLDKNIREGVGVTLRRILFLRCRRLGAAAGLQGESQGDDYDADKDYLEIDTIYPEAKSRQSIEKYQHGADEQQ